MADPRQVLIDADLASYTTSVDGGYASTVYCSNEVAAERALSALADAGLWDLLRDLTDPDPCDHLDHHGHCQTHGWLDDGPCPHARARELLAALDGPTEESTR